MIPKPNYTLIDVVDTVFPDWRNDDRKYELPKEQKTYGVLALKRIEVNKEKVFLESLETIKNDFLEDAIKRGRSNGRTTRVKGFKNANKEGHLNGFLAFLTQNYINVKIKYSDYYNVIVSVTWNFVK